MDYECERNAVRNFEPWRDQKAVDETEDERLNRLEEQQAEEENAMVRLETKTLDSKREMAIADALDDIRTRNARNERAGGGEAVLEAMMTIREERDEEVERAAREDEEAARNAFMTEDGEKVKRLVDMIGEEPTFEEAVSTKVETIIQPAATATAEVEIPSFKKVTKKKKDHAALLGIKKKPKSGLLV